MAERGIEAVIEIEAPAARIWAILTDFAQHAVLESVHHIHLGESDTRRTAVGLYRAARQIRDALSADRPLGSAQT